MDEAALSSAALEAGQEANDPEIEAARWLMSAEAVRVRSGALFSIIEGGASPHFSFRPEKLDGVADRVATLTRERFPDLVVPLHARWRHFEGGGRDRFASLAAARAWSEPAEAARAMADLAIVSVLLDAGAGPAWRYREAATGKSASRSEGLALASLAMFAAGAFSAVPADPLRADAAALQSVSEEEFAAGFQIAPDNPLEGTDGRRALLAELSHAVRLAPDLFASQDDPRPGGIIDALAAEAEGGTLPAEAILASVLEGFSPIWPSRLELAGVPLGDTWQHEALRGDGPGTDLVPFHKLSTWLSLSLIEPLTVRGIEVVALDALPGLAEYRNGGLFVDGGVLAEREPSPHPLPVDHSKIVEWRAATVTLLDRVAELVRRRLDAPELPLAAILEGGTWLAGRQLARERRADGAPPIAIASDGTVF